MVVTLYHFAPSAHSRMALLAAKAVGVEVDVKTVDLFAKEQFAEDFLKINPQHCVPTLTDGDFVLWESRAIAMYLAQKYGKNDTLYPQEVCKRAIVNQRMYFDSGTLYPRLRAICYPIIYLDEIEVEQEKKQALEEALGFLDVFLDDNRFLAGDDLTLADLGTAATVSSIEAIGWDLKPYGNVYQWLQRCAAEIPGYAEINQTGADAFGKRVKSKLAPGQI